MTPTGAIILGIVLLGVGIAFRIPARVEKPPRWLRVLLTVVFIPFVAADAPRSWIPWGLASALWGVALGTSGAVNFLAGFAALVLFMVGVVLKFWAPETQPRSPQT